jgi:hypothetical protein
MQALYNTLYEPGLPLKLMGILVGLWLVASHLFALLKPGLVRPWLKAFPRNEKVGTVLVIIGFAWAYLIWSCMDLGEFFKIERPVQLFIIGVCVGVIVYVKEFAQWLTRAPVHNLRLSFKPCCFIPANHGRQYMRALLGVIVARAVKVGWHRRDPHFVVLTPNSLNLSNAGDLGHSIGIIGRLEVPGH